MTSGYRPKEMVETKEGLIFAVVAAGMEDGRVLCFLRYHRTGGGCEKLPTAAANRFLEQHAADYLYRSKIRDVQLHGVPFGKIVRHHRPEERLQHLINSNSDDAIEQNLRNLIQLFRLHGLDIGNLGVTGSLLIGGHNRESDIDLVCYCKETFYRAREAIARLLAINELHSLDERLWRDAYRRRSCELTFTEFVWHEQRKFNKAAIDRTKFDISLVGPEENPDTARFRKFGRVKIRGRISDDSKSFDYPARYWIEHPDVQLVISYTLTYAGQARTGEMVEICGRLEVSDQGVRQIVIGTDREAAVEYMKVCIS
ncbi:MAG: hypothetical protein GY703_22110 [Gammaproteobacteria bacterium]|nr:hypothetical protein [Gammaproteobacteria bacterium]